MSFSPTLLVAWAGAIAFALVLLVTLLSLLKKPQLLELDEKWRNRLLSVGLLQVTVSGVAAFVIAVEGPEPGATLACLEAVEDLAEDVEFEGCTANRAQDVVEKCRPVLGAIAP